MAPNVARKPKARKSTGGKRKANGGKNLKAALKEANDKLSKQILSDDPNTQWEIDEIGPIHLNWGKKKTKKTNGQLVKKYYSKLN